MTTKGPRDFGTRNYHTRHKARNEEIVLLYAAGWRVQELRRRYGLTASRLRQIIGPARTARPMDVSTAIDEIALVLHGRDGMR